MKDFVESVLEHAERYNKKLLSTSSAFTFIQREVDQEFFGSMGIQALFKQKVDLADTPPETATTVDVILDIRARVKNGLQVPKEMLDEYIKNRNNFIKLCSIGVIVSSKADLYLDESEKNIQVSKNQTLEQALKMASIYLVLFSYLDQEILRLAKTHTGETPDPLSSSEGA